DVVVRGAAAREDVGIRRLIAASRVALAPNQAIAAARRAAGAYVEARRDEPGVKAFDASGHAVENRRAALARVAANRRAKDVVVAVVGHGAARRDLEWQPERMARDGQRGRAVGELRDSLAPESDRISRRHRSIEQEDGEGGLARHEGLTVLDCLALV